MSHAKGQVDDVAIGHGVLMLTPLRADWVREGAVVVVDANADAD
jgi:hypothetical protein